MPRTTVAGYRLALKTTEPDTGHSDPVSVTRVMFTQYSIAALREFTALAIMAKRSIGKT